MSPADLNEPLATVGFGVPVMLVHVLEQCGDDLSREDIMREATNIKDLELPLLLPGIKINISPDNYFTIRQMQLAQFNSATWEPFGDLMSG